MAKREDACEGNEQLKLSCARGELIVTFTTSKSLLNVRTAD